MAYGGFRPCAAVTPAAAGRRPSSLFMPSRAGWSSVGFVVRRRESKTAWQIGAFGIAVFDVVAVDGEDPAIEGPFLMNLAQKRAIGKLVKIRAIEEQLAAGSAAEALALPEFFLPGHIRLAEFGNQQTPDFPRPLPAFGL